MRIRISFFIFTLLIGGASAVTINAAKCSDGNGPVAALIKNGTDAPSKTPLILIHGIQATTDGSNVDADNKSWTEFIKLFNSKDSQLNGRFALYLFQYCSDREPVSVIGNRLRDLIDQKIPDRPHVIVAHSMGGLIAKSYMGRTEHNRGLWKGKKGGDTVSALITLATPHHGTPGANDPGTMKHLVPDKFEAIYNGVQQYYWRAEKGSVRSPSLPNRSDLRWDNFDGKLDISTKDVNTDLAASNTAFGPYASKLIAYGGTAQSTLSAIETASMLFETKFGSGKPMDEHRLLTLANIGLVNGLDRHFGDADGLVPLVSSLFCDQEGTRTDSRPVNWICSSAVRVRRFEPGNGGELPQAQLPDKQTLSIFRNGRGFDHLDMLMNQTVLRYVISDLAALPSSPSIKQPQSTKKPVITRRTK
ncbi:MAG: hypothetical protein IPG67_16160 [Acidobacteria bacterium]|nr:hypothetical protein [Acidobacteriota bacterium]